MATYLFAFEGGHEGLASLLACGSAESARTMVFNESSGFRSRRRKSKRPAILEGEIACVRRLGEQDVEDRVLSQTDTDIHQQPDLTTPDVARVVHPQSPTTFANLLEELRSSRGLSKKELADRAELDPSSITRFEQGSRAPDRDTVIELSTAMVLPLADRDRLLAAAGFRSELWDDPELVELAQLMVDRAVPEQARQQARSVVRMAIAYCNLQKIQDV